jgi:hypothetical protein
MGALRALCGLLVLCTGYPNQAASAARVPPPLVADTLRLKPVDLGRLRSGYGLRYNPILKRQQMHRGIDWAAPRGTPVRAAGDGVVVATQRAGAYGQYVEIDHGRTVATVYAHLERYAPNLRPGRRVHQGDLIGRVGTTGRATGPHLHYEVRVGATQVDPLAVAPIVSAQPPDAPAPVPDGPEGELGTGGPTTTIAADGEASNPPEPTAQYLRALPLDADAGMIRVEDLLRLDHCGEACSDRRQESLPAADTATLGTGETKPNPRLRIDQRQIEEQDCSPRPRRTGACRLGTARSEEVCLDKHTCILTGDGSMGTDQQTEILGPILASGNRATTTDF